jgi:hypothetical protein
MLDYSTMITSPMRFLWRGSPVFGPSFCYPLHIAVNIIPFWDNPIPGSNSLPPILIARRHMQKSLKSAEYERLVAILVAVRHASGVRQQALAKKLGRPQSFVAKYEGGERRIDVIEFVEIARALGADPIKLFRDFMAGKPAKVGRKRADV